MPDPSPAAPDIVEREKPSLYTTRIISHEEAKEIARRLINSHFRQEPCARVGIPARPDYDDDLLICAYIEQQEAALTAEEARTDLLTEALKDALIMIGRLKKHCRITDGAGYTDDGRMLKLSDVEESARAALDAQPEQGVVK